MIRSYFNKLPVWMRNKYVLSMAIMLIYLAFFSKFDFIYQYKLSKEQQKLEQVNKDLKVKIEELQIIDEGLKRNPLNIERIAREKYGMKRDDETVFFVP